ncbi:MAG: transcriptional regulator, AraC family [Bacteroidota bacterium]|nr:transcriptional regulator, AraC family [Bacteroidota bacterium]MDF2453835.1 transcriptional regulator, AraC family [Bacteroidota bacterium]
MYPHEYMVSQVISAKKFMMNNYATVIRLDEISDAACFSRFHFIRLFKKFYGITPNQFLAELRIAKAKEFLKQGKSVSETCFMVGFDSETTFAALFKKTVGRSPSKFKKSNIQ